MDDFVSLTNHPDLPEAGTGFIDRIQVTTFPAEVPASPGVDFLASSSWRALAFSAGGDGGRRSLKRPAQFAHVVFASHPAIAEPSRL